MTWPTRWNREKCICSILGRETGEETPRRAGRRQSWILRALGGAQNEAERNQAASNALIRDLLDFWWTSTWIWTLSHTFGSACFKSPAASSIFLVPRGKVIPKRGDFQRLLGHGRPFPGAPFKFTPPTAKTGYVTGTRAGTGAPLPQEMATRASGHAASAVARTDGRAAPASAPGTGNHLRQARPRSDATGIARAGQSLRQPQFVKGALGEAGRAPHPDLPPQRAGGRVRPPQRFRRGRPRLRHGEEAQKAQSRESRMALHLRHRLR